MSRIVGPQIAQTGGTGMIIALNLRAPRFTGGGAHDHLRYDCHLEFLYYRTQIALATTT